VGQSATFFVLTAAMAVAAAGWAVLNRSVAASRNFARGFYIVSVTLSMAALLWILAGMLGVPRGANYALVLKWLLFRGWIVVGVGLAAAGLSIFCVASKGCGDAVRTFVTSSFVLKGLCFSVAMSFFCVEIGKLSHDAEMRQFFLQSGYTVGFMYCIMAAEIAGAVGLLLRPTVLPAAIGLMAIMAGAVRTHAHNGDPFSDSLEAAHLLILLACIVVLRLLASKVSVSSPAG
jgi:DoxX-like protein